MIKVGDMIDIRAKVREIGAGGAFWVDGLNEVQRYTKISANADIIGHTPKPPEPPVAGDRVRTTHRPDSTHGTLKAVDAEGKFGWVKWDAWEHPRTAEMNLIEKAS